jgi:hypothetical protein
MLSSETHFCRLSEELILIGIFSDYTYLETDTETVSLPSFLVESTTCMCLLVHFGNSDIESGTWMINVN